MTEDELDSEDWVKQADAQNRAEDEARAKAPKLTVEIMKRLCHDYAAAGRRVDILFMEEFEVGDVRVDVRTVDLGKYILRGFEVKSSRADFVKDQKWQSYLRYFNFFYFVAPPGVIKPQELPREVHLLEPEWKAPPPRPAYHRSRSPMGDPYWELKCVKRGKKLQPRFVRETYGEHFFHRVLLKYVRNIRWRSQRLSRTCRKCYRVIDEMVCPDCKNAIFHENPEARVKGV
jgi:hypothetical protein